jgi:hypothetical protein
MDPQARTVTHARTRCMRAASRCACVAPVCVRAWHPHARTHVTHARTHTRTHTRARTHMHARTHARTDTHWHVHVHARTHARSLARSRTHTHMRTHLRARARTRACRSTHTHTQNHTTSASVTSKRTCDRRPLPGRRLPHGQRCFQYHHYHVFIADCDRRHGCATAAAGRPVRSSGHD